MITNMGSQTQPPLPLARAGSSCTTLSTPSPLVLLGSVLIEGIKCPDALRAHLQAPEEF
jgi:hypothetical protein